jgi:hypothetical protein
MILDGDVAGSIDQENDTLIMSQELKSCAEMAKALEIFDNIDLIMSHLEE